MVFSPFHIFNISFEFSHVRPTYYHDCSGILIFSDFSKQDYHEIIKKIIPELIRNTKISSDLQNSPFPILVFNTSDPSISSEWFDLCVREFEKMGDESISVFRIEGNPQDFIEKQIKIAIKQLLQSCEGYKNVPKISKVKKIERDVGDKKISNLDVSGGNPTIFISYATENEDYDQWLDKLATALTNNKFLVKIALWDLQYGDNFKDYFQSALKGSDWIVVVFTKEYLRQSKLAKSRVFYEKQILSDHKIIPLLKKGDPSESIPEEFQDLLPIDFRDASKYEESLQKLLNSIKGIKKYRRPNPF